MFQFLVRRLLGAVVSLWAAMTLTFFAIHLLPGDPAEAALSQTTVSNDVLQRRREALGLDKPLITQYFAYTSHLLQGQLGISWATGEPVSLMIAHQLAPTLSLAMLSLIVGIGVGTTLGYVSAASDSAIIRLFYRNIINLALATPVMLTGTLLVWLFSIKLHWLPATGHTGIASLLMPGVIVGLSVAGAIATAVRAGLRSVLSQPFVLAAQAKGMTRTRAIHRHALPVGLLPLLNIIAGQMGFLLSGTIIAESFFARPGLGRLLLSAVLNHDVPVVQALTMLSCSVYIALNMLADLLHIVLDPRVRTAL
jgi:peptide/nickel transport system permease protein